MADCAQDDILDSVEGVYVPEIAQGSVEMEPQSPRSQHITVTTVHTSECSQKSGRSQSNAPTGLKGKINSLETRVALRADEINALRIEIDTVKNSRNDTEQNHQGHLIEIRRTLGIDIQHLQEELTRLITNQKADNLRFASQISTLRAEKTAMQAQIAALQRRVFDMHTEIGTD